MSEYKKYEGPVPQPREPKLLHHRRRRCEAWFSGHWRCELREEHEGPHVSKAFEEAGQPFQSRTTGEWLIEVKE